MIIDLSSVISSPICIYIYTCMCIRTRKVIYSSIDYIFSTQFFIAHSRWIALDSCTTNHACEKNVSYIYIYKIGIISRGTKISGKLGFFFFSNLFRFVAIINRMSRVPWKARRARHKRVVKKVITKNIGNKRTIIYIEKNNKF